MKLTLHHINLSTQQVEAMDEFYRVVIGLHTETEGLPVLEKTKGLLTGWPQTELETVVSGRSLVVLLRTLRGNGKRRKS